MKETRQNPLFIGHGSPMNAIADNAYARFLRDYAKSIPKPDAIVVISAHWLTQGSLVTAAAHTGQIYDFSGFPEELYELKYAPPGMPELADSLANDGIGIEADRRRGIDHAAWTVVKHLYPDGDVPLLELSLDTGKTEREHFELGWQLAGYCDRNILFIGSGNLVHNLREIDFDSQAEPYPWAVEADAWIKSRIAAGDNDALIDYKRLLPHYQRPIPTSDHYLPLLYILGMKTGDRKARTIYEEMQNGSISMRSIEIA